MATFYAARSEIITPLPWPTFALPFSIFDFGGNRQHVIKADKIDDAIAGRLSAPCQGHRGLPAAGSGCPGYADLLDAKVDPKQEKHDRMLEC